MKIKFSAVLLCLCLVAPSLYAQGALGILKNAGKVVRSGGKVSYGVVKTPRLIKTPSLRTRVTAAVRRQTPALKKLMGVRQSQEYRRTVEAWRKRNISLAEQLDYRGVIVTKQPKNRNMVDAFSPDGVTWFEADEMLIKAVKDGRFVRVDEASGEVFFSPFKDGPEFAFYDEQLFKELDRSRSLGINIVPGEQAGSWHEWVGIMPKDVPNVKIFEGDPALFIPGGQLSESLKPWSETSLSHAPGFAFETKGEAVIDVNSITSVNDLLTKCAELGRKVASFDGRFNIGVVYSPQKGLLLQDSRGVLYDVKFWDGVIQAEKDLRLAGASAKMAEAVKNGRFVRFDEDLGVVLFSPDEDGPEFEFYDEQLFKEVGREWKRAKELGAEFDDFYGGGSIDYNVDDIFYVKTYYATCKGWEILSWQEALHRWYSGDGDTPFASPFIVQKEGEALLQGIEDLTRHNNWFVQLREWDKRAASLEKFDISVVWDSRVTYYRDFSGPAFSIQDSRGVLHDVEELDAVIQAEKELLQSGAPAKTPKIDSSADGGFEEGLK